MRYHGTIGEADGDARAEPDVTLKCFSSYPLHWSATIPSVAFFNCCGCQAFARDSAEVMKEPPSHNLNLMDIVTCVDLADQGNLWQSLSTSQSSGLLSG